MVSTPRQYCQIYWVYTIVHGIRRSRHFQKTYYKTVLTSCRLNCTNMVQIHCVPDIWSSDIWSFRLYGQFLAGPKRNGISYNKIFRIYGQNSGYMVNFFGELKPNRVWNWLNQYPYLKIVLQKFQRGAGNPSLASCDQYSIPTTFHDCLS